MIRYATIAVIILTCSGLSFFAGYFLNRDTDQIYETHSKETKAPTRSSLRSIIETEDQSLSPNLKYEDIDLQNTIFDKLMYAHALADTSSVEELEDYLNRAASSRDPLYNYNMVSVFLEKFTALDPTAAIRFVESSSLSNQRFISHVVTSWVRSDPEAAMDYYSSLTDLQLKSNLASRLLSDPTLRGSGFEREIIAEIGSNGQNLADFMSISQLPPAMAFEEALNLSNQTRIGVLQHAASRWIKSAPDVAIERILQHDNLEEQTLLFQAILGDYVAIDEDAAFAFAQTHLTSNARIEQHMLSVLAQKNPKRTLPLVEDFIARTGNANPLSGIISTWVQQAPIEALAYVETLADSGLQETMYASAAYSYVNSHPEEGFQWLMAQRDKYPRMVRNTISGSINSLTLPFAERSIRQINDPDLKTQLISGIGNFKATQNPDSALDWLEGYRTDPAYKPAVQNVINAMSYQNPRAAARAIEGRLDDIEATPLVGQIANNWYRASPRDAIQWVNSLRDGEPKSSALSNMAMMIAQTDASEAKRIIRSLPEGQYRNNARRNVAFSLVQQTPGEVDSIIAEYDVPEPDASHLRELANNRNRNRSAAGVYLSP